MKVNFNIDISDETNFMNKKMYKLLWSVLNQDRNKSPNELSKVSLSNRIKLWICERYWK